MEAGPAVAGPVRVLRIVPSSEARSSCVGAGPHFVGISPLDTHRWMHEGLSAAYVPKQDLVPR